MRAEYDSPEGVAKAVVAALMHNSDYCRTQANSLLDQGDEEWKMVATIGMLLEQTALDLVTVLDLVPDKANAEN